MPYEFIKERLYQARTPIGSVPISSVYGFDYPLLPLGSNWDLHDFGLRNRYDTLGDRVHNLIRSSRAMSESRINDPYYETCADLSYWPTSVGISRSRESSPIRARSLSPIRDLPTLRSTLPLRSTMTLIDPEIYRSTPARDFFRASTPIEPLRTTSISYSNTSPWNTTGFYYSPRYPEAYRGTCSTFSPYSDSRRYFDYDVFNPYRIAYFKYPRETRRLDYLYGYAPYKYSRKNLLATRR